MTNEVAVALVKLLGKQLEDVAVGTTVVDATVTLQVKAEVRRSADVQYTPTVAIPLKATLALVLQRAGFQRDAAAELLVGAMRDALNAEQHGDAAVEALVKDIDSAMDRVQAITQALPKQTRKGATKVTGEVAVLEVVQ